MVEIDERYYDGYEGEPEIFFIISNNGKEYKRVGFWEGYFGDMLREVEPTDEGWTGITYYFHVGRFEEEQWLKDKPWHIDDLALVLCQLQAIERDKIKWRETVNLMELLINLIKNAIDNKEEISIYCD